MNKKDQEDINLHGLVNSRNLEVNYRKIWAMTQINMPFYFAVGSIQEKWNLPLLAEDYTTARSKFSEFLKSLKKSDEEFISSNLNAYIPLVSAVMKLPESNEYKKRAVLAILAGWPSFAFIEDIKSLMSRFGFRREWQYHLELLVVTNKISAPDSFAEKDSPPKSVKEQIEMLGLNVLKELQHKYLRGEPDIKTKSGNPYDKRETIANLERKNKYLKQKLIHNHADIADDVFGKLDWDKFKADIAGGDKLSSTEKKWIGKVKTGLFRLKKLALYQSLDRDVANKLLKIFS